MEGKSPDEIRLLLSGEGRHMTAFEFGEKEEISKMEVRLMVIAQPYPGHPNVGHDSQVMRKIGKEWKYAGKFGVDIKESRDRPEHNSRTNEHSARVHANRVACRHGDHRYSCGAGAAGAGPGRRNGQKDLARQQPKAGRPGHPPLRG
jgi:hypothetical protein